MAEVIYPPQVVATTEVSIPRTSTALPQTTITADATIHTKGAWTELLASAGADITHLRIFPSTTSGSGVATDMLLDIGTGSAGNEVVIIPDLAVGWLGGVAIIRSSYWEFPVRIPAGTRIAARCQGLITVDTVAVGLECYGGGLWYPAFTSSTVTTYGTVAAASTGTPVVMGVNGAEGSWTEITAATTADHKALTFSVGGNADTAMLASATNIDIGTGAAAAEVAIITNKFLQLNSSEDIEQGVHKFPTIVNVPGGTRLSARGSVAFNGAQTLDISVHGMS